MSVKEAESTVTKLEAKRAACVRLGTELTNAPTWRSTRIPATARRARD
jgi:hypothetical protein